MKLHAFILPSNGAPTMGEFSHDPQDETLMGVQTGAYVVWLDREVALAFFGIDLSELGGLAGDLAITRGTPEAPEPITPADWAALEGKTTESDGRFRVAL